MPNALQSDLEILVDNVLDAFSVIDPARILQKPKLHLLKHLVQNIRRFGPAIRFSTEVFESFNAVFRQCSTHSNRQAPSRDIAKQFGHMERLKHTVCGGYWYDKGEIFRAGKGIIALKDENPILRQYLGWKDTAFSAGEYSPYFSGLWT